MLRREIKAFPAFKYQDLLSQLENNGDTNIIQFNNPLRSSVTKFFNNSPDFDLIETPVNTYIVQHQTTALKGINKKDRDHVISQIQCIQRVARIIPEAEHINALLGEGFNSAHRIANTPQNLFVEHLGPKLGGEEQARIIRWSAQHMHSAFVNIASQYLSSS